MSLNANRSTTPWDARLAQGAQKALRGSAHEHLRKGRELNKKRKSRQSTIGLTCMRTQSSFKMGKTNAYLKALETHSVEDGKHLILERSRSRMRRDPVIRGSQSPGKSSGSPSRAGAHHFVF